MVGSVKLLDMLIKRGAKIEAKAHVSQVNVAIIIILWQVSGIVFN